MPRLSVLCLCASCVLLGAGCGEQPRVVSEDSPPPSAKQPQAPAQQSQEPVVAAQESLSQNAPAPVLFSYWVPALEHAKARVLAGDSAMRPALEELQRSADELLAAPMLSVLNKKVLAASGDPHDYFSSGPYWWPNPDTPDGLPYVRRDGERNPETLGTDGDNINTTARGVFTLGLAYYFTGDERYAQNAAERLRVWFLDPATRMNPHLEYAQAIPGRTDGRGIGIIGTLVFIDMIDGINLIAGSPAWTPELDAGMKQWMGEYLEWLLNSGKGKSAGSQHNNHGTYYDAQTAALALFTGREELARTITRDALVKRLDSQAEPDGSQPHEMARTLSMSYSVMNARGFLILASLSAASGGEDWWAWESPRGVSLRKVITFLSPYLDETVAWPKEDIRENTIGRRHPLRELVVRSAAQSGDTEFTQQVRAMAGRENLRQERWHFYLPPQ